MFFLIMTVIFSIAALLLERDLAILSMLLAGIFLGMTFASLGAIVVGMAQLAVFAGLAIVLLFYLRLKPIAEAGWNRMLAALLLAVLALVLAVQLTVSPTVALKISELWATQPVSAIVLGMVVIAIVTGISMLRRQQNVR